MIYFGTKYISPGIRQNKIRESGSMKDNHSHCGKLGGVGCSVYNCVYNDVECKACTADHIKVETKTGDCKAEAACGTYTPRTQF